MENPAASSKDKFEFYTRPNGYRINNEDIQSEIEIYPPTLSGKIANDKDLQYCSKFLTKLSNFNTRRGNKFITTEFVNNVPLSIIVYYAFYFGVGFLLREMNALLQQDFELYHSILPMVIKLAGLNHPLSKRFVDFTKNNVILPMSFYNKSIEFFGNINKRVISRASRSEFRRQVYLNKVLVIQKCKICKISDVIKYFEFGLKFVKSACCHSTVHIGICQALCFRNSICKICNKNLNLQFDLEFERVISKRIKLIKYNMFTDRIKYKGLNMIKFSYPVTNCSM